MVIAFIYFLVGLSASIFGALAGIGGGILIKPILDLLGNFDVTTISILSAATVFAMVTVSVSILFYTNNIKIQFKTSSLLAISSIIGGFTGKKIFNILVDSIAQKAVVSLIQSILLTLLMALIYIYQKRKNSWRSYELNHVSYILLIGFVLGNIAAFIGIGGGPFNIAVLSLGFSMAAKEAAVNSLFIIFFSQLSSLATTAVTTGFASLDLSLLPFIVAGGIVGGILGSALLNRVTNKHVDNIFSVAIVIVILINLVNIGKTIPQFYI